MALELPQGRGRRFDNSRHETYNASCHANIEGPSVQLTRDLIEVPDVVTLDLYAYVTTVLTAYRAWASSLCLS
jgi:hypothetical protein